MAALQSQMLVNTAESRLLTFENWPGALDIQKLVDGGFSYTQNSDETKCLECGLTLDLWESTDNPLDEHKIRRPWCPFIRRTFGADLCGIRYGSPENARPLPRHTLKYRLATFEDWPKQLNQKPKDLAQAGFYYTGEGDKVICFSCGVGLNNWESDDDAWSEHKKWSPNCPFLNDNANVTFVETYKMSKKYEPAEIPENLKCVVCLDKPKSVLSLPCKHLATCEECNEKLAECPVCRKPEEHRVKVYIP